MIQAPMLNKSKRVLLMQGLNHCIILLRRGQMRKIEQPSLRIWHRVYFQLILALKSITFEVFLVSNPSIILPLFQDIVTLKKHLLQLKKLTNNVEFYSLQQYLHTVEDKFYQLQQMSNRHVSPDCRNRQKLHQSLAGSIIILLTIYPYPFPLVFVTYQLIDIFSILQASSQPHIEFWTIYQTPLVEALKFGQLLPSLRKQPLLNQLPQNCKLDMYNNY